MMARPTRAVSHSSLHIAIIGICLLWLVPTFGLLISSFRPERAIATSGWWMAFQTPSQFTLENYRQVLLQEGMGQSLLNSIIITLPATFMTILVAALAAYAFAWMRFAGRDIFFLIVVSLLVVPLQLTLIPVLRLFTTFHLTGTFPAVWLAHTAYGLPFAVFLLRNFFIALPPDLFEAAFLEGASHFRAFFSIILRLSLPSLAALAIFQFLWIWNDLLVALIYLGGAKSVSPLTLTISNLVSSFGSEWHLLTSAAFISMLLPLAIFFALQRYFV
ncbi:MAG: carbohydrate ABC transporter permease, partial [Candidatus Tectomicrobia bacterium]|nr:carbohydrate ABC transporter permease [Candidatus Tectomicrobia bacterium]